MIKNERQYRVTRGQLERFQGLQEELSTRQYDGKDDLLRKLESDSVEAQVIDLNAELAECLTLLGQPDEARPFFAQAYAVLSQEAWLVEAEPERLERLKACGGV